MRDKNVPHSFDGSIEVYLISNNGDWDHFGLLPGVGPFEETASTARKSNIHAT
jgi:hypothetical protein